MQRAGCPYWEGTAQSSPLGPWGPTNVIMHGPATPTSSIAKPQQTWNFAEDKLDTLRIKGRHEVCFALRTPVIVEAMTAIVLADLL